MSATVAQEKEYTWNGKIALASEYIRASINNECNHMYAYYYYGYGGNKNCTDNSSSHNWMFNILTNNGTSSGWILSARAGDVDGYYVTEEGYFTAFSYAKNSNNIVPVLYLKFGLKLKGLGTKDEPYVILEK